MKLHVTRSAIETSLRQAPTAAVFLVDIYTEFPYISTMHAVIETNAFLASAEYEGVTDDERAAIVAYVAEDPARGDLIKDTGGGRKVRFAGKGKGKSGGYRIITYYAAEDVPVFLLDIYSKGTTANLSQAQRNTLRKVLSALAAESRANVRAKVKPLRRPK